MLTGAHTRRPSRVKGILTTLAIAGVISLLSSEVSRAVGRRTLARERSAWEAQQLRSYTFRYRAQCFCAGSGMSFRVEVRDGRVESAVPVEGTEWPDYWSPEQVNHPTVGELFRRAAQAYEDRAWLVRVRYDRTYHYPVDIVIDESVLGVDDELTLKAGDLAPDARTP